MTKKSDRALMPFLMRQLRTASIGETLKSLRRRQGISLDMVARSTRIQRKYVEAFERDAYAELPDSLYARHFLRQIVTALHGDPEYFLSRYDEECGTCPAVVDALRAPRQRTARRFLASWRTMFVRAAIVAVAFFIVFYVGRQIHALLAPPELLVDSPNTDMQTATPQLMVSGQTEPEVRVSVNGATALTDPSGRFTEPLMLVRGVNIITVEARRKFGRPHSISRTVYLERMEAPLDIFSDTRSVDALSRVVK